MSLTPRKLMLVAFFGAACDHPIVAVPTMATTTKSLAICWREPDAADDAADTSLMTAFQARLRGAGYRVLTKGVCDVDVNWKYATRGHRNEDDESYRDVTITVRGDGPVDVIRLQFGPGEVPTSDPDRLAILIVNALNASQKVADYARKNDRDLPNIRHLSEP